MEARLVAGAAGRTVAQLRVSARRAVLRADAAAAAGRLAAAIRERRVRMFPGEDGMASLVATVPLPVAAACRSALERYAHACAVPGDERSKDQRMVDCLVDLILRPGQTGLPPVQAQLTVVAGVDTLRGGAEPGVVEGHPIPAAMVRELAHSLGLLPRPTPPGATTPGTSPTPPETRSPETSSTAPGSTAAAAAASPTTGPDTSDEAGTIADLLDLDTVAGTALAHSPAIAVVDEISGQLLALTDAAGVRAAATCGRRPRRRGNRACTRPRTGPGLGPPAATTGYRPSEPLQRFVRARDRRCRFPGCRAPAIRCDLDHNQPWPAGATSAGNLCCLCRHHHRLSHQAPGWTLHRLPDGGLRWTTPGGDRITTHPPRYGTDDHPPPGTHPPQPTAPPITPTERVLGRRPPPGDVDDDPAPF